MDWMCGSSGKVPTLKAQNPSPTKNKSSGTGKECHSVVNSSEGVPVLFSAQKELFQNIELRVIALFPQLQTTPYLFRAILEHIHLVKLLLSLT
jgi:hypothetical protein